MSHTSLDLASLLKQEITLIDSLLHVLAQEKETLITRQFERLETLSTEKQALSKQLEDSTKTRVHALCNSFDPAEYNNHLRDYLEQCSPDQARQIQDLNDQLAERIIRCREYNLINGQVIASNLNTRREIVSLLTGQEQESKLYNAQGSIKKNGDSSRHQKA